MIENQPTLQDLPSVQKILRDVKTLEMLHAAMPILKPFLKLFGANTDGIQDTLNIESFKQEAQLITSLPDKFNDTFGLLGWILYEQMNLDIAKKAIEQAALGNMIEAEQILVDYYTPEMIRVHLRWMRSIEAFKARRELSELACIDYQEQRYHACIPVVLMIIDGLVNDVFLNKGLKMGAFTQGADGKLRAWDSISAHHKGLGALTKLLYQSRTKTTTDEISIPFRNGILHGRDTNDWC